MQGQGSPKSPTSLEVCLDFTDTVDWRTSNHAKDAIRSYDDLLVWSSRKGLLSREEEKTLGTFLQKNEALKSKVVKDAHELREAIYRIFSAIAHGRKAEEGDIEVLNEHLAKSMGKLELRNSGNQYAWAWRDAEAADMMLWPIASSAADLLTSEDLARVRECANEEEGCGSLFLDSSKSHTKKWCSMDSCGNRAKVRAYYNRHGRSKKIARQD
ncbi:MAG: ABATE domain-containing protein [Thaumarchaeota archaeon]|nr:ABATE domain-containing protein [Nitrososphaerota archaeon]